MTSQRWILRAAAVAGLLAGIGVACSAGVLAQTKPLPASEPLFDHLMRQAKGNPYLEDRIAATMQQLVTELKDGRFTTQLLNTTAKELLRGVQNTKQGDFILAVDYGMDWEGLDYSPYLQANLEAANRGVQITRVFIVSGKPGKPLKRGLCHVMKRMHDAGIRVRTAAKEQLSGQRQYEASKAARVIFHYGNRHAVLMIESTPLPDLKLGDPYLVDVAWEPRIIEESIHYIDWLMDKKQSGPFDPRACGP
jgi:hypothetical protein